MGTNLASLGALMLVNARVLSGGGPPLGTPRITTAPPSSTLGESLLDFLPINSWMLNLLDSTLEVLLGSRSGGGGGCRGGSGGGSLGHFLLCGHGGHSNGHTTDGQNLKIVNKINLSYVEDGVVSFRDNPVTLSFSCCLCLLVWGSRFTLFP